MYDGHQTIPANGAIAGLNNNYDTQWKGSWLGLDALLGLSEKLSLNSTVELSLGRNTRRRPIGICATIWRIRQFQACREWHGTVVSLGAAYPLQQESETECLRLSIRSGDTDAGYDQTNFSYGTTSYLHPESGELGFDSVLVGCELPVLRSVPNQDSLCSYGEWQRLS